MLSLRVAGPVAWPAFLGGADSHADELGSGMRHALQRIKAAAEWAS